MADREPLNVSVDEDVREQVREFTRESKGKVRGAMGELVEKSMKEYMDRDKFTRIEERMQRIEQQQEEILDHLRDGDTSVGNETAHSHTDEAGPLQNLNPQLRNNVTKTLNHLPDTGSESDFERAANQAGFMDQRTINNHRSILESLGILLPDPRTLNTNDGGWIQSRKKFSLICENSEDVSTPQLDQLLGKLADTGRLSQEEYRDVLPDDYIENHELKIDNIGVVH